jgi:hypothetical protein
MSRTSFRFAFACLARGRERGRTIRVQRVLA